MKKEFSTKWQGSKQPRKQRKFAAKAPLHLRKKFVSCNLSKDLRKKYSKRTFPLRKGDEVKVMRGKYKKKQGKVTKIERKTGKIYVENIQHKKIEGSTVDVPMRASNLQIISLNLEDRKRNKSIKQDKVEQKKGSPKEKTSEEKKEKSKGDKKVKGEKK